MINQNIGLNIKQIEALRKELPQKDQQPKKRWYFSVVFKN